MCQPLNSPMNSEYVWSDPYAPTEPELLPVHCTTSYIKFQLIIILLEVQSSKLTTTTLLKI